MGGDLAGPVPTDQHDFALWEKRVDALMILCSARGLFTVDGLRRALEDLGPEAFESMNRIARHRAVHAAIGKDILDRIHALALDIGS